MNKIKKFYIIEDIEFNGFYNLKLMFGWFGWYDIGFSNKIIEDVWYDSYIKIGSEKIFFWAIVCDKIKIYV